MATHSAHMGLSVRSLNDMHVYCLYLVYCCVDPVIDMVRCIDDNHVVLWIVLLYDFAVSMSATVAASNEGEAHLQLLCCSC